MSTDTPLCQRCFLPLPEAGATCPKCKAENLKTGPAPKALSAHKLGGTFERLDSERVSRARTILSLVALLMVVETIVWRWTLPNSPLTGMQELSFLVRLGLCAFYVGMWVWARKSAMRPAVLALVAFVGPVLWNELSNPGSTLRAPSSVLIIQGVIVLALIGAIREARIERFYAKR